MFKRSSVNRSIFAVKVGNFVYDNEPIIRFHVTDDFGNLVLTDFLQALRFYKPVQLFGE